MGAVWKGVDRVALITLDHIKTIALRAKAYTSSHLSELASMMADSLEEVDAVKADKPQAVAVSIPATGWQTDEAEDAAYPLYCDISVSGLAPVDIADVRIAPGSQPAAIACGLCATSETLAGVIRLRAASAPAEALAAEYVITKGYVAPEGSES